MLFKVMAEESGTVSSVMGICYFSSFLPATSLCPKCRTNNPTGILNQCARTNSILRATPVNPSAQLACGDCSAWPYNPSISIRTGRAGAPSAASRNVSSGTGVFSILRA